MFRSEKPITAITVLIERLTKEEYEVDDLSDLPTLIEAIRLQRTTGPTEAARAIRKKLKYGNPHRQLRALTILDDLLQNVGSGLQKFFADEPLLERLRYIVTDPATDGEVKQKCQEIYRRWAVAYKDTPGMNNVATLYKQLPQRKRLPDKATSRVLRETERDEDDDPSSPRRASAAEVAERRRSSVQEFHKAASNLTFAPASYQPTLGGSVIPGPLVKPVTKKDKKHKHSKSTNTPQFNFEKEKTQINGVIGQASIEATGLMNALKHVNRETQRVSDNSDCRRRFESCKSLRRQTFRYCSLVLDESYLGTLLNANDQLSDALILYEQLDKSFDYDSDSEDYDDTDTARGGKSGASMKSPMSPPATGLAKLSLGTENPPAHPPRPQFNNPKFTVAEPPESGTGKERDFDPDEEDEDENNPFGDAYEVNTPQIESGEPNWQT